MIVKIFCSYAHEDEQLLNTLKTHLRLLLRRGLIDIWDEGDVSAGGEKKIEMNKHLNAAEIILLLVSSDFLASDYCYDEELYRALERHKQNKAVVIPIILRPTAWQDDAPFAGLKSLPSHGNPVTKWANQDEAFLDITNGIRKVVVEIRQLPQEPVVSHPDSVQKRYELLQEVRTFWIKNVLERSLRYAARVELNLHEQTEAIANPWRLFLQQDAELPSHPIPPGTPIIQIYDEVNGQLLILGEPGAGKTTLMLELARDLLNRAERNPKHPIPVVFSLSSWVVKRQALSIWLADELEQRYKISPEVGQSWVATSSILLLLDGVDEVAKGYREMCVSAINAYHKEHQSVPIVICSRTIEYLEEQPKRLELARAVMIQPLSSEQVDEYFFEAGNQIGALYKALQKDEGLRELTTTPLMLHVLSLAYQNESAEGLIGVDSLEKQRKQIFETYVERMLIRRSAQTKYTPEQIKHWLSWLAKQMKQHNQTIFSRRSIQLDWLPEIWMRRLYSIIVTSSGAILGGSSGTVAGAVIIAMPIFAPELSILQAIIMLSGMSSGGILGGFLSRRSIHKLNLQEESLDESGHPLSIHQRIFAFILYLAGLAPFNYTQFLDYAAERVLLRKVAGGYIFVHRLLLEYFASLDTSPNAEEQ